MKTTKIDTSLIIADAIIEAIEYKNGSDAELDEQTIHCDSNYYSFDFKITNVDYDREDVYEGDRVVGYYDEISDFDFEIIHDKFHLTTSCGRDSKLTKKVVLTSDSDIVKKIVFNAI